MVLDVIFYQGKCPGQHYQLKHGRKLMKNIIHALLLLTSLAVVIPAAAANPPPAYEGRRLYVSYCQLCHGTDGKGDGPLAKTMQISPADLTTTIRARSDTILT